MKQSHNYLGVSYETDSTDELYHALLGGLPVTGTTSQSRGEASMRFMLMLDSMIDTESKPMQKGDVLMVGDKTYLIDALDVQRYLEGTTMNEILEGEPQTVRCLHLREGVGGGEVNFRGPSSAYKDDQAPRVSLSGGPFTTRPVVASYEWAGVADVEFWAWQDTPRAEGGFKYKHEVNVWIEVDDESPN